MLKSALGGIEISNRSVILWFYFAIMQFFSIFETLLHWFSPYFRMNGFHSQSVGFCCNQLHIMEFHFIVFAWHLVLLLLHFLFIFHAFFELMIIIIILHLKGLNIYILSGQFSTTFSQKNILILNKCIFLLNPLRDWSREIPVSLQALCGSHPFWDYNIHSLTCILTGLTCEPLWLWIHPKMVLKPIAVYTPLNSHRNGLIPDPIGLLRLINIIYRWRLMLKCLDEEQTQRGDSSPWLKVRGFLAPLNPVMVKTQNKRKRCQYERKHSRLRNARWRGMKKKWCNNW